MKNTDKRAHADTDPQAISLRRPIEFRQFELKSVYELPLIAQLRKDMDARVESEMEALARRMWSAPQLDSVAVKPDRVTRVMIGGTEIHVVADDSVPPGEMRVRYMRPIDPLDAEYDGVKLRQLISVDEKRRRGEHGGQLRKREDSVDHVYATHYPDDYEFTPTQRAAISAHWSAQLRTKVAAAKQAEREQVVSDYDEDRP